MWNIKIIKIKWFYPPRILNEHWCIYSCLQIPPRENWLQYVRRVYATAINFPCIITLFQSINSAYMIKWLKFEMLKISSVFKGIGEFEFELYFENSMYLLYLGYCFFIDITLQYGNYFKKQKTLNKGIIKNSIRKFCSVNKNFSVL